MEHANKYIKKTHKDELYIAYTLSCILHLVTQFVSLAAGMYQLYCLKMTF
jgi:hypothetical protein